MMRAWRIWAAAALLAGSIGLNVLSVEAKTIYNSPYVTFSPDKKAWTTNAGDRDVKWYEADGTDDVATGVKPSLRGLYTGEHYYPYSRRGSIPVSKWTVRLSRANCCHMNYPPSRNFHDISYARKVCLKKHFSGWSAICADCGERIIDGYIYMSKEAAKSIDHLEIRKDLWYYYLCPFNRNLEQGIETSQHTCKAISANKYKVEYLPNAGGCVYGGYMPPSYHMYNNAAEYDGKAVVPQTRLNKNCYSRIGWQFVGWNTREDGRGSFYGDEAEIYNLCAGDCLQDEPGGTVFLYAMWEPSSGILQIDPAGGSYQGRTGITEIRQDYGSSYRPNAGELIPPAGNCVQFDTGGGGLLSPVVGTQKFVEWRQKAGFQGKWEDNCYTFSASDKNVDGICAVYARNPITLPQPYKTNTSFGGWYYDAGFTLPAGKAGDTITPERDMTLYAQWVELTLSARDNYSANSGRGAVDLSWSQQDGQNKVYKLYQSEDGVNWRKINTASDISNTITAAQTYGYSGTVIYYTIPYTGFYSLTACGAQGGNYGTFSGGLGGQVTGKFWLNRGEVLQITVGGQNGFNGGGAGDVYGCGGGCTTVSSTNRGLLMVAGGGGGAAPNGNGLAGGSAQSLVASGMSGEKGASGGGGGYLGGTAGELIVHNHVQGVCNHLHTGSPDKNGGCYTEKVLCGKTLKHEYSRTHNWKWGGQDEEYCPNCGATASKGETCKGHSTIYYNHVCSSHGVREENTSDSSPTKCKKVVSYAPGCGLTEDYTCGYPYDGYVISSKSAYGGSSFVSSALTATYAETAGVRSGNGYFSIVSEDIGYQDVLSISGVLAPDRAAPEKIDMEGVGKTAVDRDQIEISWNRPGDNGTAYYHVAESYLAGNATRLSISNITRNTLVSGVRGYYYRVDEYAGTQVNAGNGTFLSGERETVALIEKPRYFHVAAVDVAGNLSQTVHIPLGNLRSGDTDVAWPLFTRQLLLEEGDNIYAAPAEKTFYVKGDGKTPFTVEYSAYMRGPASAQYQINYAVFQSATAGAQPVQNRIWVSDCAIDVEKIEVEPSELGFSVTGATALHNDSYTRAVRSGYGREVFVEQRFLLDGKMNGKPLRISPAAGAVFKDKIIWSDQELDAGNGLWVIGDGEGPVIRGKEQLENLMLIDRRNGDVKLRLSASDELSGLKNMKLTIQNLDNGAAREWDCDAEGNLEADITEDEPIFSGDFTMEVYACDNVGNETRLAYHTTEFDLQARIERLTPPSDPIFKCGESGLLCITTWGYAERVEIEFPPELADRDETLNHTYVYEVKQDYRQEEEYLFMVPLSTPKNAQYDIVVRAYKGDKMLEKYPTFSTIGVEGSVLDEIRTRLR